MCKDTEHEFMLVDAYDTEITEDGGVTYFRPATIFCRKCGYYTHIKACHHRGPSIPKQHGYDVTADGREILV